MLLKYFYDRLLAHASYLVGCQKTGEAIVVDPGRNIEPYVQAADAEGLKIVGVAETHIHADYVSGAREFGERGARLYVSDAGPQEWKYLYAKDYDAQLLNDGDRFQIGNLEFQVLHTPGHTPESISFLLTDKGGGADKPMGIFTGDFVFVGSIGRPDLLEEAAGVVGSARQGAEDLYRSIERFRELPDYLQIWPAHGAGSACGKGLGAVPSSTVGYEKMFNPALQYQSQDEFVEYILSEQPEAPRYFAVMKRVNKEGPALVSDQPVPLLDAAELEQLLKQGATVVDIRSANAFAEGHVPGTINIPASMLAGWAGWLLDYERPYYLIADPSECESARRVLLDIGADRLSAVIDASSPETRARMTEKTPNRSPGELAPGIQNGQYHLVDVRNQSEWETGAIPQAQHHFLGRLPETLDQIPRDRPVVVQCLSGGRSAIAASLLQARGFDVINMAGGITAWKNDQLPVSDPACLAGGGCCG